MLRFNLIGLGMLLITGIVYGIGTAVFEESTASLVALLTLFVIDLAYRFWQDAEGWEKWVTREYGGMLIIVPAWAFALIILVIFELDFLNT